MGTKNNPGKFDCYANAAPDEPLFVLRATDIAAPETVRFWTLLRELLGKAHTEKLDEAYACALAMHSFRQRVKGEESFSFPETDLDVPQTIVSLVHDHLPKDLTDEQRGAVFDLVDSAIRLAFGLARVQRRRA